MTDWRRATVVIAALSLMPAAAREGQPQSPSVSVAFEARTWQPGEVVSLRVTTIGTVADLRGSAFGRPVQFYRAGAEGLWRALIGIDVERTPGPAQVVVEALTAEGRVIARTVQTVKVEPHTFPTRRITVPDEFVNPPASALPRIAREAKEVDAILSVVSLDREWDGPLVLPVPGEATSNFGSRSIINGQRRSLHAGVDFHAATGTPVRAPAGGRIVLVAEHYFAGNVVIIDHGLGVFSFLAHLSSFAVKAGDTVAPGQVVGQSGETGRVTGPHLHWSVRLGGARVDPLSWAYALEHGAR